MATLELEPNGSLQSLARLFWALSTHRCMKRARFFSRHYELESRLGEKGRGGLPRQRKIVFERGVTPCCSQIEMGREGERTWAFCRKPLMQNDLGDSRNTSSARIAGTSVSKSSLLSSSQLSVSKLFSCRFP